VKSFLKSCIFYTVLCFALPVWGASVPIKVACIGDSITEGAGLGSRTYPARLSLLLGDGYVVNNYGLGGRTLLMKGDIPYVKDSAYRESLSWEPDIVLIKLGTNDAKPQNWKFGNEYVGDFETLIASYQELPNPPRILLATPCPVFGNGAFDINPSVVADEIAPFVRDLATRLELELIDFHSRMAELPSLFPDTVHPNTRGTAVMAALAYEGIAQIAPEIELPTLSIRSLSSSFNALEWPVDAASYSVQEIASLTNSRAKWTVSAALVQRDENVLRIQESKRKAIKLYRLWKP
jgi:acyl-CoA thioesterase I